MAHVTSGTAGKATSCSAFFSQAPNTKCSPWLHPEDSTDDYIEQSLCTEVSNEHGHDLQAGHVMLMSVTV